jgi:hypothetical protein
LLGLLLFCLVGGLLAAPVLSLGGSITGRFKSILFLAVGARLAWSIYKRTFTFRDYLIYFGGLVGFCIWADLQS